MDNRVVVTGMGAITPIGNDVLEFWKNAKEGVIGIEAIGDKIIGNDKVKVIAPIKNFDVSKIGSILYICIIRSRRSYSKF